MLFLILYLFFTLFSILSFKYHPNKDFINRKDKEEVVIYLVLSFTPIANIVVIFVSIIYLLIYWVKE